MERFGNYILNPTAHGGSALHRAVLLATTPGRRPAVVLARALRSPTDVARFAAEEGPVLAVLRRWPHPHLTRVLADHPLARTDGTPAGRLVVLPPAEGSNLHAVLAARGPMPVGAACRLLAQVASALAHAHAHGIVLRGLSVGRIFFPDAQRRAAVVADLSHARLVAHEGSASIVSKAGIPAYAAPEILTAPAFDGCVADVYALGVILFVAVAGRFPFVAPSPTELFARIVAGVDTIAWPSDLPPPLSALIRAMLARNPIARPTAAAILALPWLAGIVTELELPAAQPAMSAAAHMGVPDGEPAAQRRAVEQPEPVAGHVSDTDEA
jgi:serine/threonine-protein kinase